MKFGAWLTLTGVSALACACSGTTVLGDGVGNGGSGGSMASAGSGFGGNAGSDVSPGGNGGDAAGSSPGGSGPVAGGGPVGGGAGGEPPLAPVGPQVQSNKLDVLFVLDNSLGMAKKQALLSASLPSFIERLTNPLCVDPKGVPLATQPASGTEACSSGHRQFTPVTDMHLGAISTSLGAHGGNVCSAPAAGDDPLTTHLDDQAELLPTKRPGVASYKDQGFQSYDPAGKTGVADVTTLTSQVQAMITSAGEYGCGYEAPLEAMYRFLVDPDPPTAIVKVGNASQSSGTNQELLTQRAAFLRPDSSVAIVVLSDENDCSIVDSGVGWFVGATSRMPASTQACAADPNDPCCRSCAQNEAAPPSGCLALSADPVCSQNTSLGSYQTLDNLHDSLNLRCFDQKQRFGFDLLNPVERYSVGLTNPQVLDADGNLVDNPLFAARDGKPARSASLISVSFIVGAPWEDLASTDSLSSAKLTYLDGANLESKQRWPLLLGDPSKNLKPTDPLMIESWSPRSGMSPLTGRALVPASSQDPTANSDNGHEQNIPNLDDLEYACIFPFVTPEPCMPGDSECVCSPTKDGDISAVTEANSPVCQPPSGGPAEKTQYFGKAYPGARELTVARALAGRAVPASICPKNATQAAAASYGYVPALDALVDRLAATLE